MRLQTKERFPHADERVLHKPGECRICDTYPEEQNFRIAWGIGFTGHSGESMLPCPSEQEPTTETTYQRDGNFPVVVSDGTDE